MVLGQIYLIAVLQLVTGTSLFFDGECSTFSIIIAFDVKMRTKVLCDQYDHRVKGQCQPHLHF